MNVFSKSQRARGLKYSDKKRRKSVLQQRRKETSLPTAVSKLLRLRLLRAHISSSLWLRTPSAAVCLQRAEALSVGLEGNNRPPIPAKRRPELTPAKHPLTASFIPDSKVGEDR
ncbi:hypothetical protein EYF80_035842 [Liparis tanakae]|uniref:Uncharacterized protein n=1 Tax=Liparis tanakae TaxID=230148 RepID=A0A4Z2GMC2_9TELE|nr:hypothetical protein EYF80_035842 [Liparis tanakae]